LTHGIVPDLVGLAFPIDRLDPLEGNPRRGDVDAIAGSFAEFGQRKAIVARHTADGRGEVTAGNHALAAATRLGWTDIAVVWVDDDDLRAKAFALADNHTAELGSYDRVALAEMVGLVAAEPDLLAATAYTAADLAELNAYARRGDDDPDDLPDDDDVDTVAQPGDLWLLGDHRVVCGDARDPAVIAGCLSDAEPALMVTDPPYGVDLDLDWRADVTHRVGYGLGGTPANNTGATSITGDDTADWSAVYELVPSVRVAYVWHGATNVGPVVAGLARLGFEVAYQVIWDKTVPTMGHGGAWYDWEHEPCLVVRRGKSLPFTGGRQSTIIRCPSPKRKFGPRSTEEAWDHPNQKPMAVIEPPIINHLRGTEFVFDPFLGSGTTLMAAERTGRRCVGVEVDPRFVDLTVRRWEAHTGATAKREPDVVPAPVAPEPV